MPAARAIPYVKATACGNDFLLVDGKFAPTNDAATAQLARAICNRRNGVGADGVEWLYAETPGSGADLRIRLFNSDGSEAEISGNGTRCVAAHWIAKHGGELVRVRTAAGVKECRLVRAASPEYEFEMRMGKPALESEMDFEFDGKKWHAYTLNMGNPQCVVFVDSFPENWQALGASIQAQDCFPHGVNVDFVRVIGANEIDCRFFERGAGETSSSGTGSCAAAAAAVHAGKVKSPVKVNAPGGVQTVRWDGEIFLTGPARVMGSGEFGGG